MHLIVETNFRHNGKRFFKGDKFDSRQADAKWLLEKGLVREVGMGKEPAEQAKPAPKKKIAKKIEAQLEVKE